MYYQCIALPNGHRDSDNIRKVAKYNTEQVKLKTVNCTTDVIAALQQALDTKQIYFPLVMLGQDIIGMGNSASIDLLNHMKSNPHQPWEASDGEDAL